MPCISEYPGEAEARVRGELDRTTQFLCWLCGQSEDDTIARNPALKAWWTEHQENDRRREKAEAESRASAEKHARDKANALAKLTPDERQALGIFH